MQATLVKHGNNIITERFAWNGVVYRSYEEFCAEAGFNSPNQKRMFKRLMIKTHNDVDKTLRYMYNPELCRGIFNESKFELMGIDNSREVFKILNIQYIFDMPKNIRDLAIKFGYFNDYDIALSDTSDKFEAGVTIDYILRNTFDYDIYERLLYKTAESVGLESSYSRKLSALGKALTFVKSREDIINMYRRLRVYGSVSRYLLYKEYSKLRPLLGIY